MLGQKKIKLIYLKYLRLIDAELKKFKTKDPLFVVLLYTKISKLIDEMYREINAYLVKDYNELIRDNYTLLYLLAGNIALSMLPNTTSLFFNKNIQQTISGELKNNKLLLKQNVYNKLYDFIDSGYQTSQIDDIIYHRKDKLLSGDVAKTLRLYRTESTRIRTESKLAAIDNARKLGFTVRRHWLYTWESIKPREEHVLSNGLQENAQGYFSINGYLTKGPGLFGVASEDINCRCDTEIYVDGQQ